MRSPTRVMPMTEAHSLALEQRHEANCRINTLSRRLKAISRFSDEAQRLAFEIRHVWRPRLDEAQEVLDAHKVRTGLARSRAA